MGQLTNFIIACLIGAGMLSLMGVFISDVNDNYGPDGYNDSRFVEFDESVGRLTNQSENLENTVLNISSENNPLDLVGNFVKAGYQTTKIALDSLNVFDRMVVSALDNIPGLEGESLTLVKSMIYASLIVLIILGVVVSALMKYPI